MGDLVKLGVIDPELEELLRSSPLPPEDYSDVNRYVSEANKELAQLANSLGEPPPSIKQSEKHYTTKDGTKLRAKVYQPTQPPQGGSALVVLFHGGCFCFGTPETEELTARIFVEKFGVVCVIPSYRLAPDHPFPTPVEDAYDALKWASSCARELGADTSRGFIVGGTSAGGHITAILTHRARDQRLSPTITGQYLCIPLLGDENSVPARYNDRFISYEQNRDAMLLPQVALDMFKGAYKPDVQDLENFAISRHPKGHKDLPRAYFQVAGMDILRDEGLIYESMLREAKVETKLNLYPGMPHGHWAYWPHLYQSQLFRKDQLEGIAWLLKA